MGKKQLVCCFLSVQYISILMELGFHIINAHKVNTRGVFALMPLTLFHEKEYMFILADQGTNSGQIPHWWPVGWGIFLTFFSPFYLFGLFLFCFVFSKKIWNSQKKIVVVILRVDSWIEAVIALFVLCPPLVFLLTSGRATNSRSFFFCLESMQMWEKQVPRPAWPSVSSDWNRRSSEYI